MSKPVIRGITPYIQVRDAREAIALYQKAFGAEVIDIREMGDAKQVIHAHIRINGGNLFLNDPFPEHGHPLEKPQSFTLHLQVDDAGPWWTRATAAGLEITMPLGHQFWGDTYGQLKDSFGLAWSIGSTPST